MSGSLRYGGWERVDGDVKGDFVMGVEAKEMGS